MGNMNKQCFKCRKTKLLTEFYVHKRMKDGHLNKCKTCTKKDVARRYYDPVSRIKIAQYEKERFQTKERKEKAIIYQRKMRANNPGKFKARNKVANAVKNGSLIKAPCEKCGNEKVEAHHTDYRKPLEVRWLCRVHHLEIEGKLAYN